ncbi:sugar isomerase [Chelonobacter oris]|uniref:D-lyxose/D-mannose family sugar isomerase n=1 Tax=Chelonobacter oris TaxID=505317 RepID=UPI00244AAA3A|nr:D-lyxose/D-mannose family sugar isomerase [Chelonobacter oris]MDH2999837.1 sugar isomerase [Chelonobacter oris]
MTHQSSAKLIERTATLLKKAGTTLSKNDIEQIEITDFKLGKLEEMGLQLITFINNERYCAKQLVLFPHQNCPEHRHPPFENNIGKQETFRCLFGEVYLYVEGEASNTLSVSPPKEHQQWYTAKHEIHLLPGEQYTIPPNTKHWFQAGREGAVIAEFSSQNRDEFDIFTDPAVIRV